MGNPRQNINLSSVAHRAMLNYGFVPAFPSVVMKEIKNIKKHADDPKELRFVEDMRSLLWSSIDNVDSQDLDQLEYCERAPNREVHVFIAIADVDFYVEQGSMIDKHAAHNGTSVYAEVEIFPMLPEKLCNNLSSLCEGQDRLAIVVDYFVRKDGSVRFGRIRRATVHNKAKLVYEPVGEWLENQGVIPEKITQIKNLEEQVRLQLEAAGRMHEYRLSHGALELETLETSVAAEDGKVLDIVIRKKNLARMIIENFMIGANRTMSNFLEQHQLTYIQRILRTPEKWMRIVEVAKSVRDNLSVVADPKALSDLLVRQRQRAPERFPDFSLAIVKLLGQAEYDVIEPGRRKAGHFGLAVHDYTHSTAPNRRYVDIILQRLIKAVLRKDNPTYSRRELANIAYWCTDRDRASKKVERFMVKVAGAILLSDKLGNVFDGIITGASEKGVYVRLISPPVEGRVMRGFHNMDVGNKVRVRLVHLDPLRGFVDFEGVKR